MGARLELGQLIADARRRAQISQGQLGARTGVSAQQVSRWERGAAIPGRAALARLAEALDVDRRSLDDLAIDASQEETAEAKRELSAALSEVKRFVDQYADFHASYQKIGPDVDQILNRTLSLEAEVAEIKRAVLELTRRRLKQT